MHKRTQKTKVYGSDSSAKERETLMEILRDRVEYHKDKIISQTIYEELCGLEVKKSGKIEHSSNTHDDQVFSWLWALYVYYYGGDLMNNWGITKRVLRTDADLEEAVVDIHEDTEDTISALDIADDENINEQLEVLKKSPGSKMYEQWLQEQTKADEAAMDKLLQSKVVQKTLADRYHLVVPQTSQTVTTIPTDVFLNFNNDDTEKEYSVLAGNLSKYW